MSPRARRIALIAFAVVLLLFTGRWTAGLLADRWWAERISPAAVRAVSQWALLRLGLETVGIVVACGWFIGNLLLVYRAIGSVQVHRRLANLEIREAINMRVLVWLSVAGGLLLGFLTGRGVGDWAPDVLLAWNGRPFGEIDPLLGHDLLLYLSGLPVWRLLHGFALLLLLLALIGTTTLYVVIGAIRWEERRPATNGHARAHLGVMAALLALVIAWGYLLEPLELVAGVNRTVHSGFFSFRVTTARLLTGVALAAALLSLWWALRGRTAVMLSIWSLLALASLLGHYLLPAVMAGDRASPLDAATRRQLDQRAYGMQAIRDSVFKSRDIPLAPPRPMAIWTPGMAVEATAIDSGRPVAADRAVVTIGRRPRPVWIVVRDQAARGAGVTVLLDDQTTPSGLPIVFHEADSLRSPAGTPSLRLPLRAIWPGRRAAVLDTVGDGVPVGSGSRRLVLAWALQTGVVLSPAAGGWQAFWYLDPAQRLGRLVPFAVWGTPVPRVMGGELVWLVDGYLASRTFPGSTRVEWRGKNVGMLRPAFVGVVRAESGATRVFLRHTADELAKEWQGIFDSLIQPASAMPAEVARGLPYPVELLEAQVRVLAQPHWGLGQLVGRAEQVGPGGPPADAMWEPDTSGIEQVVPFEQVQQRQIASIAHAHVADGWETLSILRIDSIRSLPSPTILQTRWTRFPTYQQLKDSVEKAGARLDPGPVRYWSTPQGLAASQIWFARREGQEPVAVWQSLAVTDRRGAGHDLEEAWQNLLGLSAPIISAGARGNQLLEARRYLDAADAALRRGDLEAFGRAWEALRRTLRGP